MACSIRPAAKTRVLTDLELSGPIAGPKPWVVPRDAWRSTSEESRKATRSTAAIAALRRRLPRGRGEAGGILPLFRSAPRNILLRYAITIIDPSLAEPAAWLVSDSNEPRRPRGIAAITLRTGTAPVPLAPRRRVVAP